MNPFLCKRGKDSVCKTSNFSDTEKKLIDTIIADWARDTSNMNKQKYDNRDGCWNPKSKNCDCPACGGFND